MIAALEAINTPINKTKMGDNRGDFVEESIGKPDTLI
jgi:hypothetical protein